MNPAYVCKITCSEKTNYRLHLAKVKFISQLHTSVDFIIVNREWFKQLDNNTDELNDIAHVIYEEHRIKEHTVALIFFYVFILLLFAQIVKL